MSNSEKRQIYYFIEYMRSEHSEAIFIVPATIAVIFSDTLQNSDLIALALLFTYLTKILIESVRMSFRLARQSQMGYSIWIGSGHGDYNIYLRKQISILKSNHVPLAHIQKHHGLIDDDWQYFNNLVTEPTKWQTYLDEILEHFIKFEQRLPINTKLHVFIRTPIPVAMGLGHVLGEYKKYEIYNHHNETKNYRILPLTALDNSLKTPPYNYISVDEKTSVNEDEIAIILSIVKKSKFDFIDSTLSIIEINSHDEIVQDEHFAGIAREIASIINKELLNGKKIHLYPGVPLTMSFIIGALLIENPAIYIYNLNFKNDTWECVLDLQKLSDY